MPDEKLKDFAKRLEQTRQVYKGGNTSTKEEGSALGLATRAVTELVVGILVSMGLGWMIDKYLGTRPWFMLLLLPVGLAAGILNVMRIGNSKQAADLLDDKTAGQQKPVPIDEDDED